LELKFVDEGAARSSELRIDFEASFWIRHSRCKRVVRSVADAESTPDASGERKQTIIELLWFGANAVG
jgi:hypothetical protein